MANWKLLIDFLHETEKCALMICGFDYQKNNGIIEESEPLYL